MGSDALNVPPMIVTPAEMTALEQAALAAGVSAESLMDEAGRRMAALIQRLSPAGTRLAIVYAGRGNNAGDAFVVAGRLRAAGWAVGLRLADAALEGLAGAKLAALGDLPRWSAAEARGALTGAPFVAVDGLLGLGARGPFREPIGELARELNALRARGGARVFALDLPSGLGGDPAPVIADATLAVGFAKTLLVEDAAVNFVGHLEVIPLPGLHPPPAEGRATLSTARALAGLLPPRPFDAHKTRVGRVGVLAGGIGTTGAAVMCALGALKAGAGLVTLFAREAIRPTLAAAAPPEVMVKPLPAVLDLMDENFDVLAVGPGLPPDEDSDELRSLLERWPRAMVIDAGALSALTQNVSLLDACAGPRLLTPHPGEMARVWAAEASLRGTDLETLPRAEVVERFTGRYPVALLLKGARALVGAAGRPLAYNSTGSPGMASGGMGDILTGVCAALLGQGLDAYDAGRLGAWLTGRAAELAMRGGESEQSLAATDLPRHFGAAFAELRLAAS